MVRVGMQGDEYVLIVTTPQMPGRPHGVRLSEKQAADLYVQLGQLLPEEMKHVEPYSADEFPEEKPA